MQNRNGQVLLIAVMLLATVITVVMTIAFNATTETQVTRLEIDSQKALAAAEAGIDAMVKQPIGSSVQISSLGQFNSQGISGTAQVSSVSKTTFVTSLLRKDEQYTFYLSDYPGFAHPWTGSFDLYLGSENGECPSVEVTIIKNTYLLDRYAYNTCSGTETIAQGTLATDISTTPKEIDSVEFNYKLDTIIVPNPIEPSSTSGLVAFIKVLGGRTKLGFQSTDPTLPLPLQGKTVASEARTASGVVKKVELFQSYPQMPSTFFMTSF